MPDENTHIGTKDVGILRKAGKLAEALEHGRRLYAETPGDPWAVRELAWCFYDEIKRLQRMGDGKELEETKGELRRISLPEDERDKILHECVNRVLGASPAVEASFRATELSKAGRHSEAVHLLRPFAKSEEATPRVGEAYGWVLYRKLKDCTAEDPTAPVWCLNEFIKCCARDWQPNAMLFKNLLIQAMKHAGHWAGLTALVEKLALHRLKPADFVEERPDVNYEPFQDQLLTAIYKSLKRHPDLHGERPALQQLLTAWKDSFGGGKCGHYHLGRILLWTGGDPDQARVLLLKAVQENPDEYWRWQALAEALSGTEAKAAISRGICCACDDNSFKVPLYKAYADLLANEGDLVAARASLDEAMRLRRLAGNEWTAPIPLWSEQAPAEGGLDIHTYAEPFAEEADELLASDLPGRLCVLIRPLQKENRFLCFCVAEGTRTLKFSRNHVPPLGVEAIEAKFRDQTDGVCKVLTWQAADLPGGLVEREIAVVDHVNADKQLAAVTTSTQDFLPLYFDRWSGASSLASGACLKLRLLRPDDCEPMIMGWENTDPTLIPGFLIPILGVFQSVRGKPFGFLNMTGKRIFVGSAEAQNMAEGEQVSGWAIRSKDKNGLTKWKFLPPQRFLP